MKTYQLIAEQVVASGVKLVFGLMGEANMHLMCALDAQEQLEVVTVRNEGSAVSMADGAYRATGFVQFATVTSGPGLSQVCTALTIAAQAGSALVLAAGDIAADAVNRNHEFNHQAFAALCGAEYLQLGREHDAAELVRHAFALAAARRRPVLLTLPADILLSDSSEQPHALPAPVQYDPPERCGDVEALADLLATARLPVIIAGRGAMAAGSAKLICRLAEATGALLATTLPTKGLFDGHRLNAGIAGGFAAAPAQAVFADADLVLGIGAELGHYTIAGGKLFTKARFAAIDTGPLDRRAVATEITVRGDAAEIVREVTARLTTSAGVPREEDLDRLDWPVPEWRAVADGLDPRRLAVQIGQLLPPSGRLVVGGGHSMAFLGMYAAVSGARTLFGYHFGAVGFALPIAAGAAIAEPERLTLLVEGDGSILMNLAELETCARVRHPFVVLVWNDGGYGAEAHKLASEGLPSHLATWNSPDFVGVAKSLGGDGAVVTCHEDMASVFTTACESEGLFVIDARVSPTEINDVFGAGVLGRANRAPVPGRAQWGITA